MKVLIVSVKTGYGHHSAAKAMINYLEQFGVTCEMLDTFEYINPTLSDSIDNGYMFCTKHFTEIYGKAYNKLDKQEEKRDKLSPVTILSKIVSNKLKDYIVEYNPDVIIGTHSYACMMMTYLREKGIVSCPLVGIITDFTVHPFWESTELDYYITPSELMESQAQRKGISQEKVLPFGIPIRDQFTYKISKQEARTKLGIEDKMTILVMMGSMGFGNIVKSIKDLDKLKQDFQILCVCGKNEKMKNEIEKQEWDKKVIPYGFVDNVDVMMDASDIIITKPGGLTSSEFLAKKLPAIIMNPIPGQENRNTEFLVNNGAAIMVTDTFPLDEAIFQLLKSPVRRELMEKSVEYLAKPDSTKNICDMVMKLAKGEN